MTSRLPRTISLALLVLLAASPAHAQFGNLRKKMEEKAKEAIAKKAGLGPDTASKPAQPAPQQASQPASQPASQTASQPESQPVQQASLESHGIAVYPGAKLAIQDGGQPRCCSFGTMDPMNKVVAFYTERLGPGLSMDAFEAKYPSAKQMTTALRNAGMRGIFFGQPRDVGGGMMDMSTVFIVMDHANGRLFEMEIRQLDSAGMVHVRQFIRDALHIPPVTVNMGPIPAAAVDEVADENDRDLRLTQEVLDRYLSARAAETAESKRRQGLFDRYEPQIQQCSERVSKALPMLDQPFIHEYCGGTPTDLPPVELVAARVAGMKSYQYARLVEHIVAYYRIRTEKGARGIRQQDWKMWDAEAFAVLDRNWARIAAVHKETQ